MVDYNINNRKIFDAHCHVGKFGEREMKHRLIEPFKGREISNVTELKQFMTRLGISKAVITPHYTPEQGVPFEFNKIVLEAVEKLDGIYGALWVSPLPENKERTKKVLESLPLKKIVALKISPDSWPKGKYTPKPSTWDKEFEENMIAILEASKKHDLVLHMHTGANNSGMYQYIPFVEKYGKGLKIQFIHMGGSAGGHMMFVPLFVEWLKKGLDFYCDISMCRGFGPAWLVRKLLEDHPEGIDRVLFASDNPWGMFESEFWRIEAIECSEEIKEKVFYKNAEKLYIKQ